MMAEKDHHCTEPNHRVKLRCEVTMQSFKTRSEAVKLRCEATMQSYDAKLRCKVKMQSSNKTLHRNFASSHLHFFPSISIIDLFIRKCYLNVKDSVPDVILKFEDFMTRIYGIKLTLF